MMLASFLAAAALAITAPPAPGKLAFGSSPASIQATLGKPGSEDALDDFIWRGYQVENGSVRVAYYHDRASQFTVVPNEPLTESQGRGWARAFFPGLDRGRTVTPDAGQKLFFGMFIMQGRPFEAQARLEFKGKDVTAVGGEIHWLD